MSNIAEKYNEKNKEGTFFFLVNQVIVKGELKDTINIEKKKLRLQRARIFAMNLTTSKKKEARIQTCVFLSSENILS